MSANDIHARLEAALRELQLAEKNAVLLFGEMMRRMLYQDLGYSSIQTYAAEALGFTPSKTSQFVRLAGALEELPRLRRSVAAGELGWTKAREVAKVATPESEERWITEAERSSSRSLEEKVGLRGNGLGRRRGWTISRGWILPNRRWTRNSTMCRSR